jgi:3-hydroxybutyryl-CoA dehydratase
MPLKRKQTHRSSLMQKGDTFIEKFKVTSELRDGFIKLFNAHAAIHTDSVYAQKRKFKSFVIHGNILSGFISHFVDECLPEKNAMCYAQNIKFNKPVYLNDELTFHAEITDIHDSVNIAELDFFFENADKIKVAKGDLLIGINI